MNGRTEYEIIQAGISDTSEAPRGLDVFYRCSECGEIIPSDPRDNVGCSCGNIFVDIDYFRLSVRDYSKFEAVKRIN